MNEKSKVGLAWPVKVFLVGLFIPWIIPMGTLNLSVYRLVLLLAWVPCFQMWVRGKAGRIRVADVAIILFCIWASLSLAIVGGTLPMIEAIGMLNIETLGGYLLARCYIRTADDFHDMLQFTVRLIVILLPLFLYEWITGDKPLLSTLAMILPTVEITKMVPRMGFWRVQGPFNHSILFGLFCGSLVALTYLVLGYGKHTLSRWLLAIISLTAFMSMSSAPIAGVLLQYVLIGWNALLRPLKHKWALLFGILFMGYLVVEFGSNQTPVQFYISRFTFDAQTGWMRLGIWEYGTASVASHPIFGIGLGDWVRPSWMPTSVDNFWLVIAMRHGIPAIVLFFVAYLSLLVAAAFKRGLDDKADTYRTGYVICMVFFLLVGSTVHFWAAVYAWFLFLMGSGVWILDVRPDGEVRNVRASKSMNRQGRSNERAEGARAMQGDRG
ncbi:O-antigen ligase family protein [Rhizobium sp. ARZ01]|nr:O-antigen ligase family protein [Rhizobium sp. ARZ01]